jgi:hypothetical protein
MPQADPEGRRPKMLDVALAAAQERHELRREQGIVESQLHHCQTVHVSRGGPQNAYLLSVSLLAQAFQPSEDEDLAPMARSRNAVSACSRSFV